MSGIEDRMPLKYHHGQLEVQTEANTRIVADRLANWVGPVGEFASVADLILLAWMRDERLTFAVLSGKAPLVEDAGGGRVALKFPSSFDGLPTGEILAGGLAINLGQARRARINGTLRRANGGVVLEAAEAFTNCRKYMAPSLPLEAQTHAGPVTRERLDVTDPWIEELLDRCETSFMASVSPDGQPDVSHRGGPPGFLQLDAAKGRLAWNEFVGDGMFKSAGNVRATGVVTLLAVDIETGNGAEIIGRGTFEVKRREKQPRADGLLQDREAFPVQGAISLQVEAVYRTPWVIQPRERIEKAEKFTSASPIQLQAPQ